VEYYKNQNVMKEIYNLHNTRIKYIKTTFRQF
jgi:hypothetical protein